MSFTWNCRIRLSSTEGWLASFAYERSNNNYCFLLRADAPTESSNYQLALGVYLFRDEGFSTSPVLDFTTYNSPPGVFRCQAAHIVSLVTKDPKELGKLRRYAHPLGKTTYLFLYLLAKTQHTFACCGALKHCLSHCVASVHELLMTLMLSQS